MVRVTKKKRLVGDRVGTMVYETKVVLMCCVVDGRCCRQKDRLIGDHHMVDETPMRPTVDGTLMRPTVDEVVKRTDSLVMVRVTKKKVCWSHSGLDGR